MENFKGPEIYSWKRITRDRIGEFQNCIESVFHREITGLLIKSVLTQTEVEQLLSGLDKVPGERKVHRPEVTIYPRGFAAYTDNPVGEDDEGMKTYFNQGLTYASGFCENFGFDFHLRLKEIFESLDPKRTFEVLPDLDGNGVYTPSQYRSFTPGEDALPIHCGNVFQDQYTYFYDHLSKQVAIKNQMSYFVMLQKPEVGGELVLFDLLYEKGQQMKPFEEVVLSSGEVIKPLEGDLMDKMYVIPEPGDMIVFAGGEVWHKVMAIKGNIPRITLGGFFSFSNDDAKIHSWA